MGHEGLHQIGPRPQGRNPRHSHEHPPVLVQERQRRPEQKRSEEGAQRIRALAVAGREMGERDRQARGQRRRRQHDGLGRNRPGSRRGRPGGRGRGRRGRRRPEAQGQEGRTRRRAESASPRHTGLHPAAADRRPGALGGGRAGVRPRRVRRGGHPGVRRRPRQGPGRRSEGLRHPPEAVRRHPRDPGPGQEDERGHPQARRDGALVDIRPGGGLPQTPRPLLASRLPARRSGVQGGRDRLAERRPRRPDRPTRPSARRGRGLHAADLPRADRDVHGQRTVLHSLRTRADRPGQQESGRPLHATRRGGPLPRLQTRGRDRERGSDPPAGRGEAAPGADLHLLRCGGRQAPRRGRPGDRRLPGRSGKADRRVLRTERGPHQGSLRADDGRGRAGRRAGGGTLGGGEAQEGGGGRRSQPLDGLHRRLQRRRIRRPVFALHHDEDPIPPGLGPDRSVRGRPSDLRRGEGQALQHGPRQGSGGRGDGP